MSFSGHGLVQAIHIRLPSAASLGNQYALHWVLIFPFQNESGEIVRFREELVSASELARRECSESAQFKGAAGRLIQKSDALTVCWLSALINYILF